MWMTRDLGCQRIGEINHNDSSRNDQKRSHKLLTDMSGSELFRNKKQVLESAENRPVMGMSHLNMSPWHDSSSYNLVSEQFNERPFVPEHVQTANLVARNIPSIAGRNIDVGKRNFEEPYDNVSSIGLSMSHPADDTSPCLSFGGIRKVKVNQVQDFGKGMPEPVVHPYYERDPTSLDIGAVYCRSENNAIALGQAGSNNDKNWFSMDSTFTKECGNFVSMGQNFIKDGDLISMTSSYNKAQENFVSMAPSYGKAAENLVSIGSYSHKGFDNMLSMGPSSSKAGCDMTFMVTNQDKGNSSSVSFDHNLNKGKSNTISFGSFHDETGTFPSGSIISSYDSIGNVVKTSEDAKVNGISNANSRADIIPKTKEPKTAKKVAPNNFPSNVKSLLSTGMFDGVPVKYYSWSREKNLKGIIKGTGYLCSCQDCNLSKVLNAYEFERHANCKTKHPNNHIYFENGKTVYAVVQELKNTPQEMLFDTIQNVTGSQINQKNFCTWKASYQAASHELRRIYGKDAVSLPC